MILYKKDPKNSTSKLIWLITTFSKIVIIWHTKISFLPINKWKIDSETNLGNNTYTIAERYFRITLTKKVKDLFNKSLKILKSRIKENTRRWKDWTCSWISRINIVKIAIPMKEIYINAMLIKISITILHRIKKKSLFTGNTEKPRVAKTIMNYKRTSGGIIIEDLKLQKEV